MLWHWIFTFPIRLGLPHFYRVLYNDDGVWHWQVGSHQRQVASFGVCTVHLISLIGFKALVIGNPTVLVCNPGLVGGPNCTLLCQVFGSAYFQELHKGPVVDYHNMESDGMPWEILFFPLLSFHLWTKLELIITLANFLIQPHFCLKIMTAPC